MPRARHQSAHGPLPVSRSITSGSRGGSGNSPMADGLMNGFAIPGTTTAWLPSPQANHPTSAADRSRIALTRTSSGDHSRFAPSAGTSACATAMVSRGPPQRFLAATIAPSLRGGRYICPAQSGHLCMYDRVSPGLASSGKVTDSENIPLTLQQKFSALPPPLAWEGRVGALGDRRGGEKGSRGAGWGAREHRPDRG